jgi:nucleotide-binding universal stress UspA family protein
VSGPAPEAILAEAQHSDYLIISTHGASGLSRWRFGSVADKVIRGAECPTLVVGPVAAERGSWLEARLMPVFRSVMVPLDGSELAEQALPEARRFADAFGCRVHVVTAVTTNYVGPSEAWAGISPQLAEDFIADAGKYLDEIKARAPGMEDATFAVKIGAPAQALIDYIDENRIDLVIMTSHGRGGFIRTALGSTTDRLLGGAAPVLILRAHSE